MPTLVWLYLTALLYYRTSATCVALAEAVQTVSHDRLTRLLQSDWSGAHTPGTSSVARSFVWDRGFLILDDTVLPKPFATAIESLAWVYSSQEHKPVDGLSLVLLVWTNGILRIPLGIRLWHKGGPSKYALALELLSYARNRLRCRPDYVLFDAWYPSKALLKRIHDYGWYFVCRLKKNRRFNGQPIRAYRRHPYWAATGRLRGGLKVLVVRYGAKYYATNRLTLPAAEVHRLYRVARPDRRGDQGVQESIQPERLSSTFLAGAAASPHLLSGRLLCAGAERHDRASAFTNSGGRSVATGIHHSASAGAA